jgi:CRP-like cAMP-binding protein
LDGKQRDKIMEKKTYRKGQVIFRKGDSAEGLYILSAGEVGLYFPTNETKLPDIILKENEIFGEMGVIDNELRMATAKALSESTLVYLTRKEFEKKLDASDFVVRGVLGALSDRLRQAQKTKNY